MFSVREYTPTASRSDSDELLGAFLAIWNAPENLRCLSFSLEPFEELQVRDWFDNAARDHIRYLAAATNPGAIVGISVLRVDPTSPFEILGLAVRPDSQGVGVGRLLVSHTLELAESLSSSCMQAAVFADNVRMLRLLRSCGFFPVRIDYHRRADGGDLVVLQRGRGEYTGEA